MIEIKHNIPTKQLMSEWSIPYFKIKFKLEFKTLKWKLELKLELCYDYQNGIYQTEVIDSRLIDLNEELSNNFFFLGDTVIEELDNSEEVKKEFEDKWINYKFIRKYIVEYI